MVRHIASVTFAAGALAILGGAGLASAHVDPDPIAVQAGTAATVNFTVEHGCAGSPTTALDIKLPDGITDAKAVAKTGWTTAVDAGVVRFGGGSLDPTTVEPFGITFTAPTAPGTAHFLIVQKCVTGELDWVEIAPEGQPEPEHPAAALLITAGPPTSGELTPSTAAAPTSDGSTATTAALGPTATVAVTTTKSKDDSHTGLIVGIVIAAVVVVGGGAALAMRSRPRAATK